MRFNNSKFMRKINKSTDPLAPTNTHPVFLTISHDATLWKMDGDHGKKKTNKKSSVSGTDHIYSTGGSPSTSATYAESHRADLGKSFSPRAVLPLLVTGWCLHQPRARSLPCTLPSSLSSCLLLERLYF